MVKNFYLNLLIILKVGILKLVMELMLFPLSPALILLIGDYSSFIQIITKDNSYFLNYSFEDFSFSNSPFFIKIANNYFYLDKINIDINDSFHRLNIEGSLHFSNHTSIKNDLFTPNIMEPFSYFPSMECNHAILSMKSNIKYIHRI